LTIIITPLRNEYVGDRGMPHSIPSSVINT